MASKPSNTNHTHYSPPRKKTKQSKMVNTRESLGEFESSIFDASDGHKLVDLIRKKKGIHVQTQKIFDDVPSQRPSLQIEIQRLDQENETLQSEKLPKEPAPASTDVNSEVPAPASTDVVNSEVRPNIEFVPKSPVRKSIGRSITSPIIKMNSTTLGRRTLLKEFEKAFLHESRFLPEICSTPNSTNFQNEINHKQNDLSKEPRSSENESPEENIICTPITISDEGSPADQTRYTENQLKESYNANIMRSLINQNKLLNVLVQQSQEEPDATLVNRDNPLTKSPRRTFTVQRNISTGKITLSPAKTGQNTETKTRTFTKKLNATPEQRKVLFNNLRLCENVSTEKAKESLHHQSSRIPILSKATTANVPPSLSNQKSTTADFVELLQKNASPNCPVIVIPVNQTFNQAPNNRTITNNIPHIDSPPLNEITSTISDNNPKETDYSSKGTQKAPNRVESPLSNVISSTTISNDEQQQKGKVPEPPTSNLRWDDIITDDASSSNNNNSDCTTQRSPLKNERKKLFKKNQSHKQHSATHEKNKMSLSYKCLDLRLRVESDEECEHNLPKKSKRPASKIGEQRRPGNTYNLTRKSRQEVSRIRDLSEEAREQNLPQRSQRHGASKINEQLEKDCEPDLRHRFQRGASRNAEQCNEEPEKTLPHRSRREVSKSDEKCFEERGNHLQHRSRRATSKNDEDGEHDLPQGSRQEASRIAEQSDKEREQTLPQRSGRETSNNDDQRGKRENIATGITEQCDKEREQNLPHRSRRETSKYRSQSDQEREKSLSRGGAPETDEQCDEERENITPNRSRWETYKINKQRQEECENRLPQRSRREGSESGEQRRKEGHNTYQLPSLIRDNVLDNQCGEEREHNLPQRSESSVTDEQQNKQRENIPQRTRAITSKSDKQSGENRQAISTKQSSQDNFEATDQSCNEHENNLQLQSQQKSSSIIQQCHEEIESRLPRGSQRDLSMIDQEINQLRITIQGSNDEIENFPEVAPPDEFRDIESTSRSTNSISLEKDLVDEISSDRVAMDVFKRPSEIKNKKKRRPKIIPEDVKKYLEVNQKLAKTQYLNVSKRKLYSKGNSDLDTSDDSSFSIKTKKENSVSKPLTFPRRSRGSARSSKALTSTNVDNKRETVSRPVPENNSHHKKPLSKAIDNEVNHKELNQVHLSRSRPRAISSPSSSDHENTSSSKDRLNNNNENETNVDENITVRFPRSTARTSKIAKNSRKRNKSEPKCMSKDVESNLENEISEPELSNPSQLFLRRSTSPSIEKTNQISIRKNHRDVESNLEENTSGRSSRSRSPRKTSQVTNIKRNSSKTNKSKTKDIHEDIESNLEEEVSPLKSNKSKQSGTSHSKVKKTKQKGNRPLTSIVNEGNTKNSTVTSRSKSRSKKIDEDLTSNASTNMENSDCGPRRSKREKKQPTAYWACPNSQYTHVYDIYNMLTKGKKPYFPEYLINPMSKKKKNKKLWSTDDNLVANTNSVDSSSNKNTNETKRQSKQKNKKGSKENGEIQSDSENQSRRLNVPSECPSELCELAEIEEQASTVPSVDKTSSQVKSKSKKKTKEKLGIKDLANANHVEQDTTSSSNSVSATDPYTIHNSVEPSHSKTKQPPREIDPSSSDCPSEEEDTSNVQKRRLTTIAENSPTVFSHRRISNTLMPPPKTNVVKKVNKISRKNTFHTEHDESIADVSSVHVNNLFDQLKNSSINNTSRLAANSSGQVSLDNRSSKKRNISNSAGKTKNVSVRLKRFNLHNEGPYDTNDKNFDSGFSSEDMNSINTKKDILLDWLVQMLNSGKTPVNNKKGLARFLQPNGFSTASADELTFEEIDGVDFAFYNSPGQKLGYLRFHPRTQKKLSCAKRYELNFVLLGGTIQMTVDRQTFDMKNGDLTTIFIGTSYRMRNITDDPALVMVIRN